MIFAYARISTHKETQKTDRQLLALREYASANSFTIDEVIEETESGKTIDRPKYQSLCQRMRSGDILIITNIDRLGRNADQIIAEIKRLKFQGVKVIVLDVPFLSEWNTLQKDSAYNMITDMIITVKAWIAEGERDNIIARVNQGLDNARAKGVRLGRPPKEPTADIKKLYNRVQRNELSKTEAAKLSGYSRQHFDRLCKQI